MDTYALFDNGTSELIVINLLNVEVKETLDIYFQSFRSPTVKESAKRGIECAYEAIFSKDINAYIQKTPISVTVKDFTQQVDGSSAGIAYAIAFVESLIRENIIITTVNLPDIVAATGEVDNSGNIKAIKNIKEKILGAVIQNADIMFYPSQNIQELCKLREEDEEFNKAVSNSGIKLKHVESIRQLFFEIGILPNSLHEKSCTAERLEGSISNSENDIFSTENSKALKLVANDTNISRISKIKSLVKPTVLKILLIAIVTLILVLAGIIAYPKLVTTTTTVSGNLALNKMAYASSNETSFNIASMAFDGRQDTRWASDYSDIQSIYVDLGISQPISCVVLKWEDAYAKQYQIQVSKDGEAWSTVYTNNTNKGGINTITFKPTDARFVKMYAWERATVFGYSLWEFEVYNSKDDIVTHLNSKVAAHKAVSFSGIGKPFPQNHNYKGCIKPDNVTQDQMNSTIKSYYEYWKAKYVKKSNGSTPGGGYYVELKHEAEDDGRLKKTMSGIHGYGMIIFALMAGYDSKAKQFFDGMYNIYNNHRSMINHNIMSWAIDETEDTSKDSDSATDGDMDIAYSLLLAHNQWGSDGKINYLSEAKRIITKGIKESEVSNSTMRTLLGDSSRDQNQTRVADWMPDHFRAYYEATGDNFWEDVRNVAYILIPQISSEYSPTTGLLPDFIEKNPPRPSQMGTKYGEDSGRWPLRLAVDYALYGSSNSKEACTKMLTWLKHETKNNPSNIKAGYKLDGTPLSSRSSVLFTAPFIAACMVDSSYQDYLNKGWSKISKWREGCDGDSVNLLCMLLISGNWWVPDFHVK